jgi:hypothetical protein
MMRDGDREIKAFAAVLERALGNENVPPAALGDLSDLLGTLEEGARLLRSLMNCRSDEEVPKLLQRVEILIEDDLPMIFGDLLPALREMTEKAYSTLESD